MLIPMAAATDVPVDGTHLRRSYATAPGEYLEPGNLPGRDLFGPVFMAFPTNYSGMERAARRYSLREPTVRADMGQVTGELLAPLLDRHGGALELFARQRCDTPADVVQEAFVQLVHQPRVPDNVVAWLYRVVR